MRRLIKSGFMVLLAIIAFASCKKNNYAINSSIAPVTSLTAPTDQTSISLEPTGANIVFQWTPSSTQATSMVLYEVAFDKAGGDFSHPVYKILSDGSGVQSQATITQDTLNKVASYAGIASSSTGTLKWTVIASVAANTVVSSAKHTLQITRPAGFAVLPTALYLTGTATEGGADVTKAIAMKQTSAGVFEVYTSLQPGTYQLTDKPTAAGTKYYLDANGTIQLGSSTTTVTAATKAYRLNLDFNVATSTIVSIDSVGLYMSAYNTEIGKLGYIGNSTWEIAKLPVTFYQFSWGRDQRYKFILHTSAGLEYWGSTLQNNLDPAGQPASYFYTVPVTNDQWNNTYKFPAAADMHNVKVDVYFPATGTYMHTATAFN
ncbi:MAG: SusE domain-containing protein [Sphingobacteriales bacterium]